MALKYTHALYRLVPLMDKHYLKKTFSTDEKLCHGVLKHNRNVNYIEIRSEITEIKMNAKHVCMY